MQINIHLLTWKIFKKYSKDQKILLCLMEQNMNYQTSNKQLLRNFWKLIEYGKMNKEDLFRMDH